MNRLIMTFALVCIFMIGNAQEVLRTQTIGGWGTKPRGNNPGTYLHEHFDDAFPNGLTIGCGSNEVILTSAQAVTNLLPASGSPSALEMSYLDPRKNELRNTLASQVIALTISVTFDKYDADFGQSSHNLENMVVVGGEFEGMSVREILEIANNVLCGVETDITPSAINGAVSSINENYVDGQVTGSFLEPGQEGSLLDRRGGSIFFLPD